MSEKTINPSIENIYSLTPLQEGMLFQCLEETSSSEYIVQNEFKITGKVFENEIKLALDLVAEKHSVLRTAIVHEKLTKPRQIVLKDRKIEFATQDFRNLSEEECLAEYESWKERDVKRNFNLKTDPLMRVALIYFSEDDSRLVFTYHHIIMDGWSLSILYGDFLKYYRCLVEGTSVEELTSIMQDEKKLLPEYGRYAQYLEKRDYSEDISFWEKVLADYENETCIMPLYPPKRDGNEMAKKSTAISQDLCAKLKQLSSLNNLTMSQIIETAWAVTLAQYSFTDDVVFGKIVSGRDFDEIPNIQKVLGVFINSVPVRVKFVDTETVKDLLETVKRQDLESIEHGHCALVDIQNRTLQRGRLIQTLFVYENYYVDSNYSALSENEVVKFEYVGGREQTNYPITVVAKTDECERIIISILYNSNLYTEKEIERILLRIEKTLDAFCENTEQKVTGISLVLDEEKERICEFNNTTVDYPREKTVVELFEEQVVKTPDNEAVVFEGTRLTYRELNERANILAHKLRDLGVSPDEAVVVLADRSIEIVVGILGILKAGGAYVPVDPTYPADRIQFILEDCKAKAILKYTEDEISVETDIPVIDLADKSVFTGVSENPEHVNKANDAVYCIYTSGTTGKPKGVLVENRNVVKLVKNCDYTELNEKTIILQTGQMMFDASTFEVWGALLNGGCVHLIQKDVMLDVKAFKAYLIDNKINTLFITTALFNQFISEDAEVFNSLDHLMFGGEATSEKHVKILVDQNTNVDFRNVYGPTETTTFATHYIIGESVTKTPIGKPISNTTAYVMQGDNLCGVGVPGELCIGGDGVARGYLNRPELTAEKFVKNPFGEGTMYRTGDLVRWLPDGNIEFLGRIDEQVKIRGFRIELGEIESKIREIETVKDCAVIARTDAQGEKAIYAYYVSGKELSATEIRDELGKTMPDYMIPSYMMRIESIPVTRNGKLDKRALPDIEKTSGEEYVAPTTPREKKLVKAFEEILNVSNIGINDNFYNLGGDSIKAIRVVAKYRSEGYIISVKDVMTKSIIRQIAKDAIEEGTGEQNYDQGQIHGIIVDTPIMKEFARWEMHCPEVFVQSVLFQIDAIETNTIVESIDLLVLHHDILRATYHDHKLQISNSKDVKSYDFTAYTSDDYSEVDDNIREKCAEAIETIDLEKGPLVKVVYFKGQDKGFLFIAIHHLIVDGVSWRILLEDLVSSLNSLKNHEPVNLPKKTASFIEWSEALNRYGKSEKIQKQRKYWDDVVNQIEKARIPQTNVAETEHATIVSCSLDQQKTIELLRMAGKAFHTEAIELLISALGLAVKTLTGQNNVAVRLEGHGREGINQDINILRTVGWFTSTYPIIISCGHEIADTIIVTKEMLRHIPNRGLGYGLLYADRNSQEPNLLFNYLGELNEDGEKIDNDLHFCEINSRKNDQNSAFDGININCFVDKGILKISVSYKGSRFTEGFIHQLATTYERSLNQIVEFCCSQEIERNTPSDYAKKDLTVDGLRAIEEIYGHKNIENIYSLTPLQEGMLFAYVNGNDTTGYVVQHILDMNGQLNAKMIEQAVTLLGVRYEVLRAGLFFEGEESPAFVVRKDPAIEYDEIDFTDAEEEVAEELAKLREEDVNRGFDLQRDSLLRVKLILMPQGKNKMIWCFHHIIMDGWCLSFLYNAFSDFYNRLSDGQSFESVYEYARETQEKAPKYSDYLRWTEEQDNEEGLKYWKDLLEDYNSVSEITPIRKADVSKEPVARESFDLPLNLSQKIASVSSEKQSTISCMLETAIGILLMKYNYEKDVVFGKVVSGRDVDVVGADEMVGLFINTIPVRVKASDEGIVNEIFDSVHKQSMDSRTYDTCPLADIQKETQKRDLFRVLYAYENYYVEDNVGSNSAGKLGFTIEESREQTDYPLTITAFMDDCSSCIKFIFLYDPNFYAKEDVIDIYKLLQCVIE